MAMSTAVSLAEQVASQAPSNARLRARLALRHFEIGKIHARLAESGGRSEADRKFEWQQAREDLVQSSAIWRQLQDNRTLIPLDVSKPDEVTHEIAKCDAALR